MEMMPRFERPRIEFDRGLEQRFDQNPEVVRLKRAIEAIITPPPVGRGTRVEQLERLLETEPQIGADGRLRYMVTSGLAVELVTGYERPHHDLDIVIMDPANESSWEVYGTDNVTPQTYWADMEFDQDFLERTARVVPTRPRRGSFHTAVVHPGIIAVQKSSDAFGRPPRSKDIDDVLAIVQFWKEREGYSRDWNPVVRRAIDALPQKQQQRTIERLRQALR